MATERYSVNPGDSEFDVIIAVGAAVVTKNIELTVNIDPTLIVDTNTATGTRAVTRQEVLDGIDKIRDQILRNVWPPA